MKVSEKIRAWLAVLTMAAAMLFYLPENGLDFIARREILMRWALTFCVGMFFIDEGLLLVTWTWLTVCLITNDNSVATLAMTNMLLLLFFYLGSKKIFTTCKAINFLYNGIALIVLAHIGFMLMQFCEIPSWFTVLSQYKESFIPGAALNTNEGGALLAAGLFMFFRKKWWMALCIVIPAFLIQKALASVISSAIGAIIFISVSLKKDFKVFIVPSFLSIAILVIFYMNLYENGHMTRIKDDPRLKTWRHSMEQLLDKAPVRGFGLGSFPYIYPVLEYKFYSENKSNAPQLFKWEKGKASVYRMHNDWLEFAFNSGIGLLFIAAWIFYSLFAYLNTTKKTLNTNIAFATVISTCVICCFHFLFRTPACLIPVCAIGIMNAYVEKQKGLVHA